MIARLLKNFSKEEWKLIFTAFLFTFCITADYAVVRPIASALFITSYRASCLPWAWLAAVPLNFWIVNWYSKKISEYHPFLLYGVFAFFAVFVNTLAAFFADRIPFMPFLLYVWKDVYILLMFQQLWSVLHSKINSQQARSLYGITFGIGGIGSFLGSCIPTLFAARYGSEKLLIASIIFYLVASWSFWHFLQASSAEKVTATISSKPTIKESIQAICSSRVLTFMMIAVAILQVSSTLADYLFHAGVELHAPTKDLRTQYVAQVFGYVSIACMLLQFVGSFLLVKYLGLIRSHRLIPWILLIVSLIGVIHPTFSLLSFHFFLFKTFDFSLFSILKEMLYVQLPTEQKFSGKSFIDVFVHRLAKSLASFVILGAEFFAIPHKSYALSIILMLFALGWLLAAKKYLQPKELETIGDRIG